MGMIYAFTNLLPHWEQMSILYKLSPLITCASVPTNGGWRRKLWHVVLESPRALSFITCTGLFFPQSGLQCREETPYKFLLNVFPICATCVFVALLALFLMEK